MTDSIKMEYGFLGSQCGLKVSKLCLGAMTFGSSPDSLFPMPANMDEVMSHAVIDAYVHKGGNFIDTANCYLAGKSEEIIGSWLKKSGLRDNMVIATKCYAPTSTKDLIPNKSKLCRKNIVRAVEESLARLQTNYIDLYQVHAFDVTTPQRETLMTLNDLVRCGKVRYIGASNFNGWQLMEALDICEQMGLDKYVSLQNQYSLLCRDCETDVFQVCERKGVGVLPWSPLKAGLLTDKAAKRNAQLPSDTRARMNAEGDAPFKKVLRFTHDTVQNDEEYWQLIDVIKKIGAKHNKTVSQISLKWLLHKKVVTSVIIGAKSVAQLEENMVAGQSDWKLTDQEVSELDSVSEFGRNELYTYSFQKIM